MFELKEGLYLYKSPQIPYFGAIFEYYWWILDPNIL